MKRLVRGIDLIPQELESASGIRAAISLTAASALLNRLVAKAPKGKRRSLLRLQRLVRHGRDNATGGFWVDRDGNLV